MSTDQVREATDAPELDTLPGGHLLRSEVRRITHRRFIRWIVVLGALGILAVLVIATTQYAKTTPELLEQARQQQQQFADEQNAYREECLDTVPPNEDPEMYCGPEVSADDYGLPSDYLPQRPFVVGLDLPDFGIGIGVMVACLAFLVGATSIGAEWSQRTLMALLFWEPRRLRVLAAKVSVLVAAVALMAAVAQAVVLTAGLFLGATRGSTEVSGGFWNDMLGQQLRCVILAVLLALIGFGIAHLFRNTGAALGAGFVYLVAELVLAAMRPLWQPWFLTTNAGALITPGGLPLQVYTGHPEFQPDGSYDYGRTVLLTNLHGGLVIASVAVALLLLGAITFKRRDLT